MDVLEENAPLAAAIAQLPGRKLVFTNGDKPYALKVLDRLGLGATASRRSTTSMRWT